MYSCNNKIYKSTNKIKTTWNILKKVTNRHKKFSTITDHHISPEAFNDYLLTICEEITKYIKSNKQYHDTLNNANYYLSKQPHRVFPNTNSENISTKEIENIIKSLKTNVLWI
jgi:hypothetical protein